LAQNKQKLEAKPGKTDDAKKHDPTLWNLSKKSKSGGQIVQEITTTDKSGKQTDHYWEAWPVDKGKQSTRYVDKGLYSDYDDAFSNNAPGTTVKASARYYDGLTLPDTFKVGGDPSSGILYSTTEDPHLSAEHATDPVERTYTEPQN
jgi:hypothetical protein